MIKRTINAEYKSRLETAILRLQSANWYDPVVTTTNYPEIHDDTTLVGSAIRRSIMHYEKGTFQPPVFVPNIEVVEDEVHIDEKTNEDRVEFEGGGVRDSDAGRPRFDLLMPILVPYGEQLLTRIAVHMAKGADHYSPRNWERFGGVEELERCQASLSRHFMQYMMDADDGEDHAAAIYFNIMAIEYIKGKIRGDW